MTCSVRDGGDAETLPQQGLQHFQSGQFAQAEACYRQDLIAAPDHAETWHMLGVIAYIAGRHDAAEEYIAKAISFDPGQSDFHNNLGLVLCEKGRFARAAESIRAAIKINPDKASFRYNLGNTLSHGGDRIGAIAAFRSALTIDPDYAEACNNLAVLLKKDHERSEAETLLRRAVKHKPGYAEAHYNLGSLELENGRHDAAATCFQNALAATPDFADPYNGIGTLLQMQGRLDESIAYFRKAIALKPTFADAHNNLGNSLIKKPDISGALESFERAVALRPENPIFHRNLGLALSRLGRLDDAEKAYRRALALKPDDAAAHSALVAMRGYHLLLPPRELLTEAKRWEASQMPSGSKAIAPHENEPTRERRLRIGYLSPDFHQHAVSYFIEPIIAHHDREKVEVYCYSVSPKEDEVTARLQEKADRWRSLIGISDEGAAQIIREDRVDVLIDLAGHTVHNRLRIFGFKPAPVQATYLGYFGTTGLSTMDYWITDEILHPMDTIEETTETIFRLPRCWVCYQPPRDAPECGPPPSSQGAAVTLGSFNDMAKISPRAMDLWARVLRAIPHSQMLFKTKQLADPATANRLRSAFLERGIAAERLLLRSHVDSFREHLALYNQVDIILDSSPYTGGTTTADALWMGVPVITLMGGMMLERMSASMLAALGRTEWIAESEDDYIAKAVALARNLDLRACVRATQRERMANSPLCNTTELTSALENAYREMWCNWLETE